MGDLSYKLSKGKKNKIQIKIEMVFVQNQAQHTISILATLYRYVIYHNKIESCRDGQCIMGPYSDEIIKVTKINSYYYSMNLFLPLHPPFANQLNEGWECNREGFLVKERERLHIHSLMFLLLTSLLHRILFIHHSKC